MRSYVLHPYQMVKDLRTEYEAGNPSAVLDGDIDGFIEAGIRWRRSQARRRPPPSASRAVAPVGDTGARSSAVRPRAVATAAPS